MSKKITKAEEAEMKAEHEATKATRKVQFKRAVFVLLFAGNVASAIMYSLLISEPDTGMYVLAGFNGITAVYFLYKAIE